MRHVSGPIFYKFIPIYFSPPELMGVELSYGSNNISNFWGGLIPFLTHKVHRHLLKIVFMSACSHVSDQKPHSCSPGL